MSSSRWRSERWRHPSVCACPRELVGASSLLVGELAVFGELVLEPQSVRGGAGVERVERRSAGGDRGLQAVGAQVRDAFARVLQERFDCPRARLAERGAVAVRHAGGWGVVRAAGESEALLGALDDAWPCAGSRGVRTGPRAAGRAARGR